MTLVHTDVDGASKLNIGGFGELEGPELGGQKITILCAEVLKQIRVHGTTEK